MASLREEIDGHLRAELVTIGTSIEDARTGQMWAFDSERLSRHILTFINKRVNEIENLFDVTLSEQSPKAAFQLAIQAVIKELGGN